MSPRTKNGKAGYSLVEVTLALLVVAIGLTATFALFPEGLRATRAAVDDTEIALFAEYVFTTLDLTAISQGADWTVDDCAQFKSVAFPGGKTDARFKIEESTGGGTSIFYWVPDYYGVPGSTDYDESNFAGFWTSAFTYQLDLYDWEDGSTYARLVVWPGEYKTGAPPDKEKRVFTRAIQSIRGEALP